MTVNNRTALAPRYEKKMHWSQRAQPNDGEASLVFLGRPRPRRGCGVDWVEDVGVLLLGLRGRPRPRRTGVVLVVGTEVVVEGSVTTEVVGVGSGAGDGAPQVVVGVED